MLACSFSTELGVDLLTGERTRTTTADFRDQATRKGENRAQGEKHTVNSFAAHLRLAHCSLLPSQPTSSHSLGEIPSSLGPRKAVEDPSYSFMKSSHPPKKPGLEPPFFFHSLHPPPNNCSLIQPHSLTSILLPLVQVCRPRMYKVESPHSSRHPRFFYLCLHSCGLLRRAYQGY